MKKIAFSFFPILFTGFAMNQISSKETPQTIVGEKFYDGPYVMYRNDKVYIKYVLGDSGQSVVRIDSMSLEEKNGYGFQVATDEPEKNFSVQLKKNLVDEKCEYKKVTKQLVLSDIEGNFFAFRTLLQKSGVIDANYNWTFGDGHLVLVGDFFDRGTQVTEVLWLIYSLEEKAKEAGGYVHFIMGNHEIMNLSGDLRYLPAKYFQVAAILNEDYVSGLYGSNSELGRWLRTKNIAEKIGDILFVHGGISAPINNMDITLSKLNELSKPYYPDTTYKYSDQRLAIIMGNLGPFWYRGYYKASSTLPVASLQRIDSTLEKFGIKHITTGHTIIADTISILHDGKLFNTDVHHAKGHSEALLIQDGKYYRINSKGEKFLLKD